MTINKYMAIPISGNLNDIDLPQGWALTPLGAVCSDVDKINTNLQNPEEEFLYLDINSIDNKKFEIIEPKVLQWRNAPSRAQQIVKSGDVLFSTVRTYLKNIALVPDKYNGQIASTGFCVIRGKAALPGYLFHLVLTNAFLEPLNALQRGTSYPAVRNGDVFDQIIPIPPLPEQHRIVEKLERLFARLARAEAALAAAETALERYRQSVLNTAFKAEDEEGNLKEGWKWVKLGELITFITAGKSFRCEERPPINEELGIVKVSSVTWGTFNENESKTCFNNVVLNKSYKIKKGDFLFSRANTIQLVGACTIVEEITKNLMLSDKILRIDFKEKVDKTYVLHYLRSKNGRKEIEKLASGNQESMRNIGQDRIKNISIPTPEFENQKMVSNNIEVALSRMSKLNFYIFQLRENCNSLRHSILQVAFSGRLVSQLEGDEPAEILLRRIKEAKQNAERKETCKQKV